MTQCSMKVEIFGYGSPAWPRQTFPRSGSPEAPLVRGRGPAKYRDPLGTVPARCKLDASSMPARFPLRLA